MAPFADCLGKVLLVLLQLSLEFGNIPVSLGDWFSHSTAKVPDAEPDRRMHRTHTQAWEIFRGEYLHCVSVVCCVPVYPTVPEWLSD